MRIPRVYGCAALLLCLGPAEAAGQGAGALSDASDKEVARALAERGFELLEQGDAEKAIVSFRMAERRIHSPVHQLFIARAEARLGRLVEAIGTYEGIIAEKFPANAPKPFNDAQEEARKELAALKERVPSIKIVILGVPKASAQVSLDRAPLKPDALGVPRRINPGRHTLSAHAEGAASVEKTLSLAEGAYVQTIEVTLDPSGVSIPAVIAFSLGGVGLVVGTATGIAYLGKSESDTTLGVIALSGLCTGGVGIIAGTTIVALSSSGSSPQAGRAKGPHIKAALGPGSILLSGTF